MQQKILVIDDSKPIHGLIKARLGDEPIEMYFAEDGEAGIVAAVMHLPDLILLDVDMPGANGYDVCKRLMADPRTMGIPIIFLSGMSSTDEKIRGLELGAVDYIAKPFDPAELRARVRASLRTKYLLDLLSKKAMIDGLTGLWNRAFFDQRLTAESALSRRSGHPLSVVLLDVDCFKLVNDQHGHPFGDEVLRTLAHLLVESARAEDVVCRYGGEEFVLIAPNTTTDGAVILAERLRRIIYRRIQSPRGQWAQLSCSFGVAELQSNSTRPIIELADEALYVAKNSGRNCVARHGRSVAENTELLIENAA